MKAPNWIIEMMKAGEPVRCRVWDAVGSERVAIVSAFAVDGDMHFYVTDELTPPEGEWFTYAEPTDGQ